MIDKTFIVIISLAVIVLTQASTVYSAPCGNGVCQASQSETCLSCPQDCGTCSSPTPTTTSSPTTIPTLVPTSVQTSTPTPISTSPTTLPTTTPLASSSSNGSSSDAASQNSNANTSASNEEITLTSTRFPKVLSGQTIDTNFTASSQQNPIASIEFKINSNEIWQPVLITDGVLDEIREEFRIPPINFSEATYSIQIRITTTTGASKTFNQGNVTVFRKPPIVKLDEFPNRILSDTTPTITGFVKPHPIPFATVEISLDNGLLWNRATLQSESFSFEVQSPLDDGNYIVLARAIDIAGNIGKSEPYLLIVDTLPPKIGSTSLTSGSQEVDPVNGVYVTPSSLESKFTISLKGGVVEASVHINATSHALIPISGTTLWTTTIPPLHPGLHQVFIKAEDGARNELRIPLTWINSIPSGKILHADLKTATIADLTVFSKDPILQQWVVWDGNAYGQKNPQPQTDAINLFLPVGEYYLSVSHPSFQSTHTSAFVLSHATVVNPTIVLEPVNQLAFHLHFIDFKLQFPHLFPNFSYFKPIETTVTPLGDNKQFDVPPKIDADLDLLNISTDLYAITFVNTWSSLSRNQIALSNQWYIENPVRSLTPLLIFIQDSESSAVTFMRRGNYAVPFLADPLGDWAATSSIFSLPTTMIISENREIQSTYVGVIDPYQLSRLPLP